MSYKKPFIFINIDESDEDTRLNTGSPKYPPSSPNPILVSPQYSPCSPPSSPVIREMDFGGIDLVEDDVVEALKRKLDDKDSTIRGLKQRIVALGSQLRPINVYDSSEDESTEEED